MVDLYNLSGMLLPTSASIAHGHPDVPFDRPHIRSALGGVVQAHTVLAVRLAHRGGGFLIGYRHPGSPRI
ncbi:hypothetical protein [Streptomyces sp. NPDC048277]|uniref:hypothetical protein n=1 Tax=Streptomyces sp. NPDC048277 TaxID=3155027 RepID=UPI0033F4FD3C